MNRFPMKKVICICIIATFLVPLNVTQDENKDIYHELAKKELLAAAELYKERSLPVSNEYTHAKEILEKYPMHSYTLALKTHKKILREKFLDENEKNTLNSLIQQIESKKNKYEVRLENIEPGTIACLEWISLAKRNLNDLDTYLAKAKERYDKEEYKKAKLLLIEANYSLIKLKNVLHAAKKRNKKKINIDHQSKSDIVKEEALIWINTLKETIGSTKEKTRLVAMNNFLELSEKYYQEKIYYLSLLKAAEGMAFSSRIPRFESHSKAIEYMEKSIKNTDQEISAIYNDPLIDAPLTELTYELSKLHLRDAKRVKSDASITIATISIQETLIVRRQIDAILDLRDAIDKYRNEKSHESLYFLLSTVIISVLICILIFLFYRRSRELCR